MGTTDQALARMRATQEELRAAMAVQADTAATTALAMVAAVEVLVVIADRVMPADTTEVQPPVENDPDTAINDPEGAAL